MTNTQSKSDCIDNLDSTEDDLLDAISSEQVRFAAELKATLTILLKDAGPFNESSKNDPLSERSQLQNQVVCACENWEQPVKLKERFIDIPYKYVVRLTEKGALLELEDGSQAWFPLRFIDLSSSKAKIPDWIDYHLSEFVEPLPVSDEHFMNNQCLIKALVKTGVPMQKIVERLSIPGGEYFRLYSKAINEFGRQAQWA